MPTESKFVLEFFKRAESKTPDLRVVPSGFQLSRFGMSHTTGGGWGGGGGSSSRPDLENAYFTVADIRVAAALTQAAISGHTFHHVSMMEEWMMGNTLLRVTTIELHAVVVSGVSQGHVSPDRPAATSFSLNFNNLGSR